MRLKCGNEKVFCWRTVNFLFNVRPRKMSRQLVSLWWTTSQIMQPGKRFLRSLQGIICRIGIIITSLCCMYPSAFLAVFLPSLYKYSFFIPSHLILWLLFWNLYKSFWVNIHCTVGNDKIITSRAQVECTWNRVEILIEWSWNTYGINFEYSTRNLYWIPFDRSSKRSQVWHPF